MKKVLALTLVAAVVALCSPAMAAKHWDDMSWWGNTGATPDPVADSQGRSGYWWWPTNPASNSGDSELWGNRGIVYHSPWEKPAPPEPPVVTPPPVETKVTRTKPVLNNVLFDFDKSVLKPQGQQITGEVVDWMKKYPQDRVLIEGHTCDIGTEQYNMGLGQRRANAVQTYMTTNGVPAASVSTQSFGETTPAVPNTSAENRKLNRRAVFNITIND